MVNNKRKRGSLFNTVMEKLLKFIHDNGGAKYRRYNQAELKATLELHEAYGTLMTIKDKKGIVAVARWNWENEETAHILDVIIRKGERGIKPLKALIILGLKYNPEWKYMRFERNGINSRVYKVTDFLGGKNGMDKKR